MATFYNQATLTYRGGTVNSNIVSATLSEALSVSKTSALDTYRVGERMTYTVGIVNSSDTPVSTVTLTDDLGAYAFGTSTLYPLSYVSGSLTLLIDGIPAAVTVTDTQPLTVGGFSIPAESSAVIVYNADVTAFAPPAPDGEIVNTVTVNSLGAPVSATETVTAEAGALLTMIKEVEPDTITGDGPLTYTLIVQNQGNTEAGAGDDVVISDVFDPILTITEVTLNSQVLTEGVDYTYNSATGEFATVSGRVTVPAATYDRDPVTGAYTVIPGSTVLTVSGTV
jgi:uncharacterized repeat protein (TIGR01451 family)